MIGKMKQRLADLPPGKEAVNLISARSKTLDIRI